MINRLPNESRDEWFFRVVTDKVDKKIDVDWTEIMEVFGIDYTRDQFRKEGQGIAKVWRYIQDKKLNSVTDSDILNEIEEARLQLQKERYKLQSLKPEINKWVREQSRSEQIFESLSSAIEKLDKPTPPSRRQTKENLHVSPLVLLADQHFGKDEIVRGLLGEVINEYNPKVFKSRMWQALDWIVSKLEKDNLNHLHLSNLGDAIDGILRASQLQKLKMGAVDQTMEYANFMVYWLNELSKYTTIDYYSILGNHSETRTLNSSRGEFDDENFERVINWFLMSMLKDNKNINIHNCGNFHYREISGVKTLMVHGQYEKNMEQSLKDYMISYGHKIDLVVSGHLHHNHSKTIGMNENMNIDFIQAPSFCGVDDYAMKLKKAAKPAVKMLLLENGEGITTTYDLKLK
jgi:predicted phosphodiesterase